MICFISGFDFSVLACPEINTESQFTSFDVKTLNMKPLLRRALLRFLGFFLLIFLSPLLFVRLEYTEKDDKQEKYQLLSSLYTSMGSKYNMSLEEFNMFCSVAYEAMSVPKPQWTYLNAIDFVVQTVTTIGK